MSPKSAQASRIAFIGTGGTIASIGGGPFDLLDYNASEVRLDAHAVLAMTGLAQQFPQLIAVDFRHIDSTSISVPDWAELAELCKQLSDDPSIDGIVIGHGTASLEETAWLLSLLRGLDLPIVVTGSMRPLTGISTDAGANLAAAIRVASAAGRHGGGCVHVVMNDEIHTARAVTKTHTLRLNAFQSPWTGTVGSVEGETVRLPSGHSSRPGPWFDRELVRRLPRVDIVHSHVGADGTAIRAFVEAGAKGIVSAGFGPGAGTPAELDALAEAVAAGVVVVQSSRTVSGSVVDSAKHKALGIIAGSDIGPEKARILLALCLARGDDRNDIEATFANL